MGSSMGPAGSASSLHKLERLGVSMLIDRLDSGLVCLTRHYRLNEACDFPQASNGSR